MSQDNQTKLSRKVQETSEPNQAQNSVSYSISQRVGTWQRQAQHIKHNGGLSELVAEKKGWPR